MVYESLPQLVRFKIKLPINKESQSFISWIYEKANVLDISYSNYAILTIDCNVSLRDKILTKCQDLNGFQIF